MRSSRRWALKLLFCCFLLGQSAYSQAPQPRLREAIREGERVPLPHSRSPQARPEEDAGAVPSDTRIPGITLVFKRSAEQQAALDDLLAAQQNPASPFYHQWLTPGTFAARFGMADEDLAKVQAWLQAQGFHLDDVPPSHDRITFSGTALQVQAAFGAELHRFRHEGALHIAPNADLNLPADLAPLTADVLHLSDFRPLPSVRALGPRPAFNSAAAQAHYLLPKDIATMYDLNGLYKNGFNGRGQSLAIVGQSYIPFDSSTTTAVQIFSYNTSLNYPTPLPLLVPGSGVQAESYGDQSESELDLEYSAGIAPGATTLFVYVGANQNYSVFDALYYAIGKNLAPVISISYGLCESLLSASYLSQANALLQQAAAQGQTIVAAAGDAGSTACAPFSTAQGISTTQQQALAVSFPADSPYVTAVGGTQMASGTLPPVAAPTGLRPPPRT